MLWTRVVDPLRPDGDRELVLEVARDPELKEIVFLDGAPSLRVQALAEFDHCVKVRVNDLEPGTVYYYRFRYEAGSSSSRVGRTKTAPAEDADVPVRCAVASCQDYEDKYYHLYRWLADQELDFVVFLGDYVYETVENGAGGASRRVSFGRPGDAIVVVDGRSGEERLAARSLDNYRDLYRTYRADADLQRLHERFPFIAIWDDHEFSNDCHGATATYLDGQQSELDVERRAAADQAWFEYMPVDYTEAPTRGWSREAPFPDNLGIYRRFVFGRHAELVMTDCRRYRPDHVVPEDAFPGAIFVTADELPGGAAGGELPLVAAVDIDEDAYADYRLLLRSNAEALGFRASSVTGNLSVQFINEQLARVGSELAPLDADAPAGVRGYAYHQLLKSAEFSSAGARYLVAFDPFRALADKRFSESEGASERMLGQDQRDWFLRSLQLSTRTFKLWGSSLCLMPRQLDLTGVDALPEEFRTRLLVTVEDWDGYPNEREELLRELAAVRNVVALSGDLHCFFVGQLSGSELSEHRLTELVTGAVSSGTWLQEIRSIVEADDSLPPAVALAATSLGSLLSDPVKQPNPHLAYQELERNGVTLLNISADALEAELVLVSPSVVAQPPSPGAADVASRLAFQRFRLEASNGVLTQNVDGKTFQFDGSAGRWESA